MQIPIRELSRAERSALEQHFLALRAEDRRLRFGAPFSDYAVRQYVARIDFEQDAVFGVADDELRLLGVAHVARSRAHAELGVSVLEAHRGRGIGAALTENAPMMRLARRQRMGIVSEAGGPMRGSSCRRPMPAAISTKCSPSASRSSTTP